MLAICAWRLAEIVQHRAGFKPYLDFSWWSPVMVIAAALEVDVAILAVSCPVFWPLVEEHFFGIVVRHEVRVTSHERAGFDGLEDSDGKSEHGSETALAGYVESTKSKGPPYYTEELILEPLGRGEDDVTIRGQSDSQTSWLDTTM